MLVDWWVNLVLNQAVGPHDPDSVYLRVLTNSKRQRDALVRLLQIQRPGFDLNPRLRRQLLEPLTS